MFKLAAKALIIAMPLGITNLAYASPITLSHLSAEHALKSEGALLSKKTTTERRAGKVKVGPYHTASF